VRKSLFELVPGVLVTSPVPFRGEDTKRNLKHVKDRAAPAGQFGVGYQPPTKHCARQERDLRAFAKKAGYKIVGGLEGDRFRKKRYRTRLGKSSGPQHFGDN
jgi:hypothetical protein